MRSVDFYAGVAPVASDDVLAVLADSAHACHAEAADWAGRLEREVFSVPQAN